jgi:hypothetical protein
MRRFLANILYLVVGLPVAFSALILLSVRPWVLDRDVYRRFVEDDRLYAALEAPELASRAPRTIELKPVDGSEAIVLEGPALVRAAQKDLPWPLIKSTASRSVDAALDAVAGTGSRAVIDLRMLKENLKKGAPALARDYASGAAASGASPALPKGAETPAGLSALIVSYVDAMPDSVAALRPNALPLQIAHLPIGIASRAGGLSQALLDRMAGTTTAIAALLLALLGALGGTSLTSRLARSGRYILLPSIVVLGIGIALAIPGGLILQNVLPPELRDMIEGHAGAQLRAYLASALGPIARDFFLTGLVGASLGGVLASAKRFAEPEDRAE